MTATHVRAVRAVDGVRAVRGSRAVHGLRAITRRRRRTGWRALTGVLLAIIAVVVVAATAFHATGGRWFVVETPSMGTAAPVGTLVLTVPAAATDLRVGDVVTFHPPTAAAETYTHRIVAIHHGRITTRGDANGAVDPWRLRATDVVGVVRTILPGVGWLVRALPLLIVGLVALWLVTSRVRRPTYRSAARVLGVSVLLSGVAFVLRPFVGTTVLQTATVSGGTEATVVSTGMLPVRVAAPTGAHVDLVAGQVGHLTLPTHVLATQHAAYHLTTALHLPPWGWVLAVALCAVPLLWTLVVGLPGDEAGPRRHRRTRGLHT